LLHREISTPPKMKGDYLVLRGKIEDLRFYGQEGELPVYSWEDFDINSVKPACKVVFPDGTAIALSRWKGPKRTRTYPLASVYETYSFRSGKIITVIPIIKDEGADTNLDRVNFITLSWMSLMNVYIVLAWYASAKKKTDSRITDQKLEGSHVRAKIEEILQYKMDAHHWNIHHFTNDFISIYDKAIERYAEIARDQQVQLHSSETHNEFVRRVRSEAHCDILDLERFKEVSLAQSQRSAISETFTEHRLELRGRFPKPLFEIENYLGGKYYLTADEVEFINEDEVIIRESKNTTRGVLPSMNDIKDGLFKLLLYSQLSELYYENRRLRFAAQIRLTGKFSDELSLPAQESHLQDFLSQFSSSPQRQSVERRLTWLNRELELLGIQAILRGNTVSAGGAL
jgi:hypothetical protein